MITKLLSIEIPTCNYDIFNKFITPSLKYFTLIKDFSYFNVNFQNYSSEHIEEIINKFKELNLDIYYSIDKKYDKPLSLIDIREDTHKINPKSKFSLSLDDDIYILDYTPIYSLIHSIHYMLNNKDLNVITLENETILNVDNIKPNVIYGWNTVWDTNIKGPRFGIVVRNCGEGTNLFKPEFHHLKGGAQDRLLIYNYILLPNHGFARIYAGNFLHRNLPDGESKVCGGILYKWFEVTDTKQICRSVLPKLKYKYIYNYAEILFDYNSYNIENLLEDILNNCIIFKKGDLYD